MVDERTADAGLYKNNLSPERRQLLRSEAQSIFRRALMGGRFEYVKFSNERCRDGLSRSEQVQAGCPRLHPAFSFVFDHAISFARPKLLNAGLVAGPILD
jgi:hypothetical protein